ncbi:hypothetical protein GCM10027568_36000 [Humibacter soli]
MLGILGSLVLAVIGGVSAGFAGFVICGSLPVLITAIIGLRRRRRTWLNVGPSGTLVALIVASAVVFVGAVSTPAQVAASSAAQNHRRVAPQPSQSAPAEAGTTSPTPTSTPVGPATTAANPASGQITLNVLAALPVKPRSATVGYDRVIDFGTPWLDMDANGCDTRDDILARDLHSVVRDGSCVVTSGTLADPYTGTTIEYKRGADTAQAVEIDDVVGLEDAWETGASALTLDQRETLANDPLNLLLVGGPASKSKSGEDASAWLPQNSSFSCAYVTRQVAVKAAYDLWVTQAEHDKMKSVLSTCPGQTMPVSSFATGSVVTAPVPPTATPSPTSAPPAPKPVDPAPAPAAPAPAAPAPAAPAPAAPAPAAPAPAAPAPAAPAPADPGNAATALCNDGSLSFSQHASGTCSHHGGVQIWYHHPS